MINSSLAVGISLIVFDNFSSVQNIVLIDRYWNITIIEIYLTFVYYFGKIYARGDQQTFF